MNTRGRTPCTRSCSPRLFNASRLSLRWAPSLFLFVALLAPAAEAQEGRIEGVVVAEQSGNPLGGVQVVVTGSNRGTLTRSDGTFTLTGLEGAQAELQFRRLGYAAVNQTVSVGQVDLRVAMSETAIELDQVVVTGTAGEAEKRELGNVVAQIDAAEVVETAPVGSLQELVNGRAPGVVIIPGTGMVGGGARIRIRGASTLSLGREPLIYVDGVRVNNSQGSGPTNQGFGSAIISRLNDYNPSDIESIEIIKGPAAATLYGTEASNGVIQIITKRGARGEPGFSFTTRQGAQWFANAEERVYTNWGPHPESGEIVPINIVALERERGNPDLFRTGHLQEYDLSVSGGGEQVRYYLGGHFTSDEGVEPDNQLSRYGARANVTVYPAETVDIQASMGYIEGRTDLSWESGAGGLTWTSYYASPTRLNTPRRGFWSATPEAYYAYKNTWQDLNRFTGSVRVNHRPFDWLSHRLTAGVDQTREENVELSERNSLTDFFSFVNGYKSSLVRQTANGTVDYGATASFLVNPSLGSNTSVGFQLYREYIERVSAYGEDFPAPGVRSIDAAAISFGGEDYLENTTVGVFVQEQLDWNNRLFLTGAVRADDNSAFGENFDLVYYPKVSASWVVSEEPFWNFAPVDQLRLRAAYGESGQQPSAFAALRTFEPVTGPNDQSAVTPGLVGNPDLGPERGKEVELGFDAGLFGDRLGLEFTFYNQRTTDAILTEGVPPSSGFSGFRFINLGEIRNTGFEVLANAAPVVTPNLAWDVSFSLSTNDNEVVSLGADREFISGGTFIQHRVGFPVGSWFGPRLVSADLDADGDPINVMCDDGEGGSVSCSEAPDVYLGRNIPEYEGALTNTLILWRDLRLSALFDFKHGYSKLDGNRRVRCWFFALCRENYFPHEFDPVQVAGSDIGIVSDLIEDAGFVKFRELSASYTVPSRWIERLGFQSATLTVAGRNLYTWTDYPGLEPEASFMSGSRGDGLWEQNVLPQMQQFVTTINFTF
ncbi:MAG: TonB-dependent receptor domain-containing protein [Longimicrobiaceae bacterium]